MADFYGNNGMNSGNGSGFGSEGAGSPFGGSGYGNGGAPFGGSGYGNGGAPFGGSGYGNGGFGNGLNYNRMNYPQKKETHFGTVFLIASIIGAVIFYLIGEIIYRALILNVNSILFMGFYFAVFGLVLAICFFIAARICRLEFSSRCVLVSGGCILVLFVLGMLFEFLYELNVVQAQPVKDNYIFAIDNSGSMAQNDPDQKRVSAIHQLLEDKDESVRFAVYTFSEEIRCIREMQPVSDGVGALEISPNGGTPIVGVLTQIMDDMDSGALPYDVGSQVILLTDGYATDNSFFSLRLNKILKEFNKKKVSISTVGLGDVDEQFLSNISGKTGGISVTTDNVDELGNAMASAVRTADVSRNLLSARAQANLNWLYAIMRILFVAILGMVFIGIKVAMTDDSTNARMIIISSVIGSVLGAMLLEIGLSFILTEFLARLILVVFISLLLTTIERVVNMGIGYGSLGRL